MSLLSVLFEDDGFMPHGTCILWRQDLLLLHSISDALIALAYYSIPVGLVYFVIKRRDIEFRWLFSLFGIFILACGTSHLFGIITLWHPYYFAEGAVKAVTAATSIATAAIMWRVVPLALAIPGKQQLEAINRDLETQVAIRLEAERSLTELNAVLERRVRERTAELERTNAALTREIADRKRAEAQLFQSQKMEAIGHLTGGLAHDFNNLNAIVMGNLDLIADTLATDAAGGRISQFVKAANRAATRGAELIRQLLAFSRQQPLEPRTVDVNALVAEMISILGHTLGEDIVMEFNQAARLWPVVVDPTQLSVVVANLATNARDAMPFGGRLRIHTRNVELDAGDLAGVPGLAPGEYVALTVSDTGTGIAPDVLPHIFEPFFTTKPVGKGTGLGLSMAFGFIQQSGGYIGVESEVGVGTAMHIFLPRAGSANALIEPPAPAIAAADHAQGETVFVVEDNPGVRASVVAQLARLGYRTIEAESGVAALGILKGTTKIDLLFTDVIMPGGMTGKELAQAAVKLRPGLKVLFTSGFLGGMRSDANRIVAGELLLIKPYRKTELAFKLREALDRG